jgi:B12-binding domain/radical SAM domain protein
MALGKDERPFLIFWKTRGNRFTLPVILGCLEGEGLHRTFRILLAGSAEQIPEEASGAKAIAGFSFMTPQLWQVKQEVEKFKTALGKEAVFLAGGPHATGDPQGTLRLGFDFAFTGESERTLPAFLRQFLAGKVPETRILSGEKDSCLFSSYPPHSLEQRYFSPVEITRGCVYNCSFCQTPRIFGRSLRHRGAGIIAGHLKRAIPYGFRRSAFISPNAFSYGATGSQGANLPAIEELLNACRQAGIADIHFGCFPSEVRPDWVHPEILQLVKRYCRNKTIVLGAQSGSDSTLARLNRGHTAQQGLTAARWIREAGFTPHADFVFGFPGETLEDRELSLRMMETMIRENGAKIHAHTFMPLPGTPLFQKEPSRLDPETKNELKNWEQKKKLDGWWKEQEDLAWKIVEWRDKGLIGISLPGEFSPDY